MNPIEPAASEWHGYFDVRGWSGQVACSIDIDLNPIRACLADTPESSEFTAAYERIIARQQAEACMTRGATASEGASAAEPVPNEERDSWLSPVPVGDVPVEVRSTPANGSSRRASDRGFLPMTLDEYLNLLDWTGRAIRSDKRLVMAFAKVSEKPGEM